LHIIFSTGEVTHGKDEDEHHWSNGA